MKLYKRTLSVFLIFTLLMSMAIAATVPVSALATNDDYRAWSHHDSRWSGTAMGTTGGTLGSGGAPTTAITKLAIQAGLRDAHDFNIGDMATLLTANSGYSGSAIVWSAPTKGSLNLFSSYKVLLQATNDNPSYTSSTKYSNIRTWLSQGYHLVVQVVTSSGGTNYVAVDEKRTLAQGSSVYIMDCLSNASNNINVILGKRYSSLTRIIGYKGEAAQSSTINADYRKWELNNTNWASTALDGTYTVNNSKVGGGDIVLASTKLAVQAGLWSENTVGGVNAVNRAVTAINSQTAFSGGSIANWTSVQNAFGFSSSNNALMGDSSSDTATMSTSLSANQTSIINYLTQGYYLVIRINNSVGWVAVDTEKTLTTGEVYIMRSTPDASKNADIKLTDYYATMNRVGGFKVDGVQVNLSGNANFTAKYVPSGGSTEYSFSSGEVVPDDATVTITASPNAGYNAADNWTITGGYSGTPAHTSTTYSFVADKDVATTATITYTATPRTYDINYSYGENSASFDYTTVPSAATTGSTVNLTVSPKTDGSFVYELKIVAKDSSNNEIPVTRVDNTYSFTMPASDVTVTFTGQNVDDWRRWARDDERWRDTEMTTNHHTVQSDGAVMISLAKLAIQAGLHVPTTLSADGWDVNDVVTALRDAGKIQNSDAQLYFDNTSATALGFDSLEKFKDTSTTSSTRGDIKSGYVDTIVAQLKQGYHQVIRLHRNGSSFETANSEWFVIDEEKTLAAVGDTTTSIPLSSIYIFRATADANKNANYTLQDLYDATGGDSNGGYRYVWRNYAYLGGTTPARKVNFTIKKDGTALTNEHKGAVAATYTVEDETTSFVSGGYVPSRANIRFEYVADPGYYAFNNWTTSDTSVTTLSATETDNPKEFNVSSSEFRASGNSTTANISCNVTPEQYHIYYTDGANFTYSNNDETGLYNTTATFKIVPDSGYTVTAENVSFKDQDDNAIGGLSVTKSGKIYTFTMPAKDVYISATASTQTVDDYRMWGVNDSRWNDVTLRPGASVAMGTYASDGDIVVAMAKLLIQAGYNPPSGVTGSYSSTDSDNNETYMRSFITKATSGTGSYVIQTSGKINSFGWGYMPYNLGIIGTPNNASNGNYYTGATAGGTRTQAFVYPQLLNENTGPYTVSTLTPLIKDYLAGTYTVTSGLSGSYDSPYNTHSYKFHIMLYINSTYGWVAVDEAQTLNTGEIWVWASHGVVSGNGTSQNNICRLSDLSTTFSRAAGFKFANGSVYYGSSKANFTPYLGDASTANATLRATYSYLGQTYPSSGNYASGLYVPHGATVTISRTALAEHYTPADKTYGAWYSPDSSITPTTYSASNVTFDTAAQAAASSRKNYNIRYYIEAVPRVHIKFLGDAHGTLYGARTTLSNEAVYYQGDAIVVAPVPDSNYEVDTLTIKKMTDSSYATVSSEEAVDPEETLIYFDADRTGGAADTYFIVQATFKGHALRITYNYKEYNPSLSGTFEYKAGDGYLVNKSYTKTLDSYDASGGASAISTAVSANAPVLQNNYFNYTVDLSSVTSDTTESTHTATVTLTPVVKNYTVSVNGTPISGTYHYQEELTLDAADYGVTTSDLVWSRGAESGKSGTADVCYSKAYSFRVTSDLNLTVGENLSSRSSANGTSAVTPGYTEIFLDEGVEKCRQNFYIQDFFDESDPRVYDSYGDVIDEAEDVTFLGAGVLFYAYNTTTNKPTKIALDGKVDREDIYSVLNNNRNSFLSQATAQGNNYKSSNLSYSYINASTDNGTKMRYSTTTDSYNYFFSATINNNRTAENQKYVYKVYSFYVCSYTLDGETYVCPVMSDNYAQAKLYSLDT